MKENIIQIKSYDFALDIIKLYKELLEKKEYILSKQILRSGTSIGANIEEALGGHSRNDFSAKLSIAYKEARETLYWLKLLHYSKYINQKDFCSLEEKITELLKIIGSIKKTIQNPNS